MATYVVLANLTDQGIRNVKDSPDRFRAFRAMAEKLGVTIKSVHYTVGAFDLVITVEGADEDVTTALLKVGTLGNIRTQSLRAYSLEEITTIINKIS
jgi:uncharacterized protein with GYD domain